MQSSVVVLWARHWTTEPWVVGSPPPISGMLVTNHHSYPDNCLWIGTILSNQFAQRWPKISSVTLLPNIMHVGLPTVPYAAAPVTLMTFVQLCKCHLIGVVLQLEGHYNVF